MAKGKIIFLNGVSSSGKTTLAKTLQDKLSEPFYVLSNDMFTDDAVVPDKFTYIDMDATYQRALKGLYYAVKGFSDAGINTIADDVLLRENGYDRLKQCVDLLHDYPILFVHVTCPIDELRRREENRGDRGIGQSESQLADLTPQDTYDITVDTHINTKEECADKIIELLDYPEKFTAFDILWRQQYEIVELTLNDLPKCSAFWGYPNSRLEGFLSNGTRRVFAYKSGDEYIGGCALIINKSDQHGHFSDFSVREDLRGNGVGSRILEFAINLFEKENIKTVRLHVNIDNTSAMRLYLKFGFMLFEDMPPDKIAMMKNMEV